jgi:DNA-binding SARP family transcriptional activator
MNEPCDRRVTTFQVLGPLAIRVAGRPIVLGARRQQTVLAMLLLCAGRTVPVESLIEAVWPDGPPATGRTQVAICVTALRKLFREAGCADDVIVTGPRGYLLPPEQHRIDAVDFAARVADARGAVRNNRTSAAIGRFSEALALWRGPALPGMPGAPIRDEITRLEQERLVVHEELAAVKLAVGQHDTVAGELSVLVREHPTRQTARAQLMLAQYRSGRRAEALATYDEAQRLAVAQEGPPPGAALRDLREAILNDSPGIAGPDTSAGHGHPDAVPAQLPAAVPAFTGRARELSVLDHLVGQGSSDGPPTVGLLTGGPGVGKTGLAVYWAHRVASRFPDGRLFVDLHGHDESGPAEPGAVLAGFLRALGVAPDRVPSSLAERAALYRSLLDRRRMLVVLDNARSFGQVAPLVPGGGDCCVLVTSRGQLGDLIDRHGATRLRLGPLDAGDAVELLGRMVADARVAGDPDGTARLAELCDRLPLALRVAAARLVAKPHWTIANLVDRLADPAARLDELSTGEQDMRVRILASYRDLTPRVALLFRRLAAAEPDGFGARVAAAVVGTTRREAEGLVESLVDAHLVDVEGRDASGETRYRLPALLRLFACERGDPEIPARPRPSRQSMSGDLTM